MSWQQVSPRYVRQDYPGLRALWYCDTAAHGGGELVMWLDAAGRLVGFQLTREEWPSLAHYVAEWRAGSALRLGTVDEGSSQQRGIKPAPLLRFDGKSDPGAAARLLAYFRQNAAVLAPRHRQVIAAVLGEAASAV